MQQHRVARLHLVAVADQVLRGQALQHHRRGGVERDRIGQPHHDIGRHHAHLRVGAGGTAGVGHAVAHGDVAHALAHRFDHAGAFHAQPARQRLLVQPGAEIDIDVVQAHRLMAHAHFAGAGIAHFDIDPLHDFGTAGLLDPDGFAHLCRSSLW